MSRRAFELERRRARVVRITEKRPPAVEVVVTHRTPTDRQREALVDLLLELLDEPAHSGAR